MAFQLKLVPCLLSSILLLSSTSFSHAKAHRCKCPDSDNVRGSNHTTDHAGLKNHMIDRDSGFVGTGLTTNDYSNKTGVLSTVDRWIKLWQDRPDGLGVDEASFSVNIVYQPMWSDSQTTSLAFLILPGDPLGYLEANDSALAKQLMASNTIGKVDLSNPTSRNAFISGSSISVKIGTVLSNLSQTGYNGSIVAVDVTIDLAPPVAQDFSNSNSSYSVWIDYDRVGRILSVCVDVEGKPKPDNAVADVRLSISSMGVSSSCFYFGVLSTVELACRAGFHWNATIEGLPNYDYGGGLLSRKVTVLSSVLGSVATTTMVAAAVAFYFNSRYRRWHMDQDQLARSMERLPGMPTKIEFADIRKATGNFHETMKLGGGGFGTVYRCTLPAADSKMEQPLDVAVKRFTRDVRSHRFDDFLAEVSIINRLRHKNIVPLIGWSYNKGEPLLVFEFMTNGSLDQHLFPRGGKGSTKGQLRTGVAIRQWATRYEIMRDIATGLHYVHHEYEPLVLHRDIKASNIMLDLSLCARLGDFGLACTVDVDRNSATGVAGTWGYIAPEYAVCGKATRQTDIYALGVLILEVVTGQRALTNEVVDDDDVHITDRVWRYHSEGRLLECLDPVLITAYSPDGEEHLYAGGEAERLLLLGLACSNPNPSDRPTMPDVVRVIAKSAPPPEVPRERPRFVWPPQEEGRSVTSHGDSVSTSSPSYLKSTTTSTCEVRDHMSFGHPTASVHARAAGGPGLFQLEHSICVKTTSALVSREMPCRI